jgi:hypothetical protein
MSYRQLVSHNNQDVVISAGNAFSVKRMTDLTFIFVWNPSDVTPQGLLRLLNTSSVGGFNPYSDGKIYMTVDSSFCASSASYTATDGWRIDVFRKVGTPGTTVPRHSYYLYDEGVWHHTDMASAVPDSTATPGFTELKFWMYSGTEYMHAKMAGAAIVNGRLTDGDCDGLEKGIPEWNARGFDLMIRHDESPNETSALNVPCPPFGPGIGTAAFSSFGEFGADGFDWPSGFFTGSLTKYNPPAPWSYSKDAMDVGSHSGFYQRMTFKGTRNDAVGWTLGNQFSMPSTAYISAVWFYPPDGFIGDFTWRIYSGYLDEGGSLLATGTVLSGDYDHDGGWQRFPITPVDISGINFMVAYDAPSSGNGSYIYTPMDNDHAPGSIFNDGFLYVKSGCFASSHNRPDTGSSNWFGIDAEVVSGEIPGPGGYDPTQFFPYFA